MGQAVFAPTIGAEWNYYFKSDKYDWAISPLYPQQIGIATITYTKDTLIQGLKFKKLVQSEKFKRKGNDTLFSFVREPFFMMQRNDSVFLWFRDTLYLSFAYNSTLGSTTKHKSTSNINFTLELKDTISISPINQSNLKFKRFSYKASFQALDISGVDPLILDEIGPLNADITIVKSVAVPADRYYTLICYRKNSATEYKFSSQDCNTITSVAFTKSEQIRDYLILKRENFIWLKLDNDNEYIKTAKVYDTQGRIVYSFTSTSLLTELNIPFHNLNNGIYMISVVSNSKAYPFKKYSLIN